MVYFLKWINCSSKDYSLSSDFQLLVNFLTIIGGHSETISVIIGFASRAMLRSLSS